MKYFFLILFNILAFALFSQNKSDYFLPDTNGIYLLKNHNNENSNKLTKDTLIYQYLHFSNKRRVFLSFPLSNFPDEIKLNDKKEGYIGRYKLKKGNKIKIHVKHKWKTLKTEVINLKLIEQNNTLLVTHTLEGTGAYNFVIGFWRKVRYPLTFGKTTTIIEK